MKSDASSAASDNFHFNSLHLVNDIGSGELLKTMHLWTSNWVLAAAEVLVAPEIRTNQSLQGNVFKSQMAPIVLAEAPGQTNGWL